MALDRHYSEGAPAGWEDDYVSSYATMHPAEDWSEMPDCSPSLGDEPLLSTGEVHFVGQPVFLVVAESHLAARRAARLGRITYAERPALLTLDQALAANSRFEPTFSK